MNPIIVIALLIQLLLRKISPVLGAIASLIITIGILIWGMSAYASGAGIMLFEIPLSFSAFLFVCGFWLLIDLRAWRRMTQPVTIRLNDNFSLRAAPAADSGIVAHLDAGDEVRINSIDVVDGFKWAHVVSADGRVGYVLIPAA